MMATVERAMRIPAPSATKTILRAGLLAGVLDGTDAAVFMGVIRGTTVKRVFQFIASGALGSKSFSEGWGTADDWPRFFLPDRHGGSGSILRVEPLSFRFPALIKRPAIYGPLFGVTLFFFMHYGVEAVSAAPTSFWSN